MEIKKNNIEILKTFSILLVEDDVQIRNNIGEVFKKMFKNVYICENGLVGLETYKKNQNTIDMIWTDINMPEMDGLTMIEEIRKINNKVSELPVLVSTAFNDSEYLLRGIKIGIVDYIVKPTNLQEVIKRLILLSLEKYKTKMFNKQHEQLKEYHNVLGNRFGCLKINKKDETIFFNELLKSIYKIENNDNENNSISVYDIISNEDLLLIKEGLLKNNGFYSCKVKQKVEKNLSVEIIAMQMFTIDNDIEYTVFFINSLEEFELETKKYKKLLIEEKKNNHKDSTTIKNEKEYAIALDKVKKEFDDQMDYYKSLNDGEKIKNGKLLGQLDYYEKEIRRIKEDRDKKFSILQKRLFDQHEQSKISSLKLEKVIKEYVFYKGLYEEQKEDISVLNKELEIRNNRITDLEDVLDITKRK
jgi:DNA-binding response OmpR family regulator/antitoxin component HigA of HigAB toxin-antitoxin module